MGLASLYIPRAAKYCSQWIQITEISNHCDELVINLIILFIFSFFVRKNYYMLVFFQPRWIVSAVLEIFGGLQDPIMRDGVSLKTPRPRGWVRAGRPSGGESSFNKRNMYQYPHVSQLFILTSVAKPGIPGAIKIGWVWTADYRMLLGTAVQPVLAWKNGR